jgi:enhancing lycopene biosynthesis protein 2
MSMKIGVLLSGSGVYDGAEIQEAVLTLLEIEKLGYEAVCIGIDAPQHHTINHLTGEQQASTRNMLEEAARIARGKITEIKHVVPADIDALIIPGGFGSAKNFSTWAFDGPLGIATPLNLTIGSASVASPYDISAFQEGLRSKGMQTTSCDITEICVDAKHRIITAPCYMLETSLPALQQNIQQALLALKELLEA